MLNPNLSTPVQVIHKLEREMYRSFHHENYIHKSDHFYNFCITALSLKDYIFDYLKIITKSEKQPFYDEWAKVNCLRAATEIANTSKHCVLENSPKTRSVVKSTSIVVEIYINDNNDIKQIEEKKPDYKIILADGTELLIYEFTNKVLEYWKGYLQQIGIEYVTQNEHTFFGNKEP